MRIHIKLGDRETTVNMESPLCDLVALKLGELPHTREGKTAVKKWAQKLLDEANDPDRVRVSQWLQAQAIFLIADKMLSERYDDWLLSQ